MHLMIFLAALVTQQPPAQLRELMLDAHVRVIVEPQREKARYIGSGVVIYSQPGLTEILTCKHCVTGYGESPRIIIEDDDGPKNRFKGAKVLEILFNKSSDLAIVKIASGPASGAAKMAPRGYKVSGQLHTVGASNGGPPDFWSAKYVDSDKAEINEGHQRTIWNMRIAHTNAQGRSGGGVYDSAGYLVGILWGSMDAPPLGDGMSRAVDLTIVDSQTLAQHQAHSGVVAGRNPTAVIGSVPALPQARPVSYQLTPSLQSSPTATILLFHKTSDPVELYRAVFGESAKYLNADSDNEAKVAAAAWGVKSFPAALIVRPNPDGSYASMGQLYGSNITPAAIRAMIGN